MTPRFDYELPGRLQHQRGVRRQQPRRGYGLGTARITWKSPEDKWEAR
ncbi:MAG: hypothetical protein U1F30_00260 [Steroidobacteraceae bacterium]